MSRYRVEFSSAAAKQIRKLEAQVRRKVLLAIAELETNPRPDGVEKLSAESNAWRIRIGDYRVLYEIHDRELVIVIFRAAHRREVY
ncbi:type II toxin-antitoxin system RelE/ParE family toxin [Paenarthrobacter sp. NPDC056912]|uniref:type II toxin-antitoxin system RelE family toxin n=1 Tax=Paenarthrobacter sp. NPDC056912 TaxID=3345965 RepID=UPI00366B4123